MMATKKKAAEHAKEEEVQVIKFVKMIDANGTEADVHPAEVENYRAGGFQVVA